MLLSQIPKRLLQATIAIEDRDFYKHNGFSIKGIVRAATEIIFNHKVQGGSTITQQLIKSALLTPEISITRKIKEIILAFWAERMYSKDEILEMYLNQVPYGGTAWGVEAASRTYFNKPLADLTLAEIALLAGLPAAPSDYSPFGATPKKAFDRQAEVLRRMIEDGYITREEAQTALSETVRFSTPNIPIRAPHFVIYIKDMLEKRYGARMVEHGGLRVITSLDVTIQEKVQDIVKAQVDGLTGLNVGNGAALVTDPKTGEILAMVGSKNYFDSDHDGNVNVTTSLRQPGSSIKVVTYALALEQGFTAASILDDSPVVYTIPNNPPYAPVNYDGKFHGATPLRYALANSYNVPAVKLAAKLGVPAIVAKGRVMGINSWSDPSRYGLSITLGGAEVTMLDMAKVFGSLANNGVQKDTVPILEVSDYTGKIYERNKSQTEKQAIKPDVAWIMGNILSDNAARTNAFGPNSALVIPGKTVSVKTGTSNDKRDNWTIGYTPSILGVVWVGNNDNTPMSPYLESGNTGAAPIWNKIMTYALKDSKSEWPQKPENVIFQEICALSGLLPDHGCPTRGEYFIKNLIPKEKDNVWDQKRKIWVFKDSHKQPGPNDRPNPDQITEEDHLVISDPLQKDFCVDCAL